MEQINSTIITLVLKKDKDGIISSHQGQIISGEIRKCICYTLNTQQNSK
jgi:hypothetical protein